MIIIIIVVVVVVVVVLLVAGGSFGFVGVTLGIFPNVSLQPTRFGPTWNSVCVCPHDCIHNTHSLLGGELLLLSLAVLWGLLLSLCVFSKGCVPKHHCSQRVVAQRGIPFMLRMSARQYT